jgi:dihydrofolate reductase
MDRSIDFGALFKEFDTAVMGRKTYEAMAAQGGGAMPGLDVVVFSRTLPASKRRGVEIVNGDPAKTVAALKEKPGRDIWLFGGGSLFRSLLDARLVDTVEVAVMPVLIGDGIPLLPPGARPVSRWPTIRSCQRAVSSCSRIRWRSQGRRSGDPVR